MMIPEQLAKFMDATNLKLDSSDGEICALCDEAAEAGYASVCVYPTSVSICSSILYSTPTSVCTVIGFPHGRSSLASKKTEIIQVADIGANEVDIVMNYAALRAGEKGLVSDEIAKLCEIARENDLLTKVIVETCFLKEEHKVVALKICEDAHANFIKTSTGFGTSGATRADVSLFKELRTTDIKIKASGGIRCLADSLEFIRLGAERLGVSAAGAILAELRGETSEPTPQDSY